MMQKQIDELKKDHHELDKALAVVLTRTKRNETEVKDLNATIHETKTAVVEIKAKLEKQEAFTKEQFSTLNTQHNMMLTTVESLSNHVMENTKSNLKLKTVYQTVSVIVITVSGLLTLANKVGWL